VRTETDALLSLQRFVAAALPDFTEVLTEVENERPVRPFAVVSRDDDLTPDEFRIAPEVTMPVTIYAYVKATTRTLARKAAEDASEQLWQALLVGGERNRERLVPLFDYAGRPAVQRVQLAGATAGTWTLALDGVESDPLTPRAQPRLVRLAVEQLDPAFVGNVWVYGRLGGPYDVRFDHALRGAPVDTMTLDVGGLTGPDPAGSIEVLSVGAPEAWRGERDWMRVEAPTFGGLVDPDDSRRRTVTVGLRLTWGRFGRVRSGEMKLRTIDHRL